MDCINYAFNQLMQPIFQQLNVWICVNLDNLTIAKFLKEIKHYMGVLMLTAVTKQNFNTVIMKPTESINKHYQRLFKW